jgi:hypothetical protein
VTLSRRSALSATIFGLVFVSAGSVSAQSQLGLGLQWGSVDRFAVPETDDEPSQLKGRLQGFSATVAVRPGQFGLGFEWNRVPSLQMSPTGFWYRDAPGQDRMSLQTISLWFAPVCDRFCLRVSGGVGEASYEIDVDHLNGDVMWRFESDEDTLALRFGISAEYGDRIRPTVMLAQYYLPSVRPWWSHPSSTEEIGVHLFALSVGASVYVF